MPTSEARPQAVKVGMLQSCARILLVPGWTIAIAVMLKGYADIGDGFSAGVIAALVMILQGLAFGAEEFENLFLTRMAPFMAIIGLTLAFLVAFIPMLFGRPMMGHWPAMNQHAIHFGVLEVITPVLFDVAVFLVVYGFCVGATMAVARSEVRQARQRERIRAARQQRQSGQRKEGGRT